MDALPQLLVLANRLPFPLEDGWKVRTFHIIRALAQCGDCTLLCFHREQDSAEVAAAGAALGSNLQLITVPPPKAYTARNLGRGLFRSLPVHVWNQESGLMRRALRRVLSEQEPDVVISESTFMVRYLDMLPEGMPRIIDTHNIDSVTFGRYVSALPVGPRRWFARATVRKLATLESRTFAAVDAVWVCSDVEQGIARRLAPDGRVWTVPNGVNTTEFAPVPGSRPVRGRILFFGRLDYYPNVEGLLWFVREILPAVQEAYADCELCVVGAAATREVEAAVAGNRAIRLLGRVPDVHAVLTDAAVVVVPLRVGGGTRLKVLEALSMAKPVVGTSIGAEGIDVEHGRNIVLADTAPEFAAGVAELLRDPNRAQRLGERGRELVRNRYDWKQVGTVVARCLDEVLAVAQR